jgi:hypothetical protein
LCTGRNKQYQLATLFSKTSVTEVKKEISGLTTADICHLNPDVFRVILFEANKEPK